MDSSANDGYVVWDAKHNRPIVGGKVTNPHTGLVEDAGPLFVSGPPSINATWINMDTGPDGHWRALNSALNCSIDKALCEVALHVQQGVYTIESLNASAYSLTIVCRSSATSYDFRVAIRTMKAHLHGHELSPPEHWVGDDILREKDNCDTEA